MEDWQINHIRQNLPQLLKTTRCSTLFLAELLRCNVITAEDEDTIVSSATAHGKSRALYRILETRPNVYDLLKNALEATRQAGAHEILSSARNHNDIDWTGSIGVAISEPAIMDTTSAKFFRGKMTFRNYVSVKTVTHLVRQQSSLPEEISILGNLSSHSNIIQYLHAEKSGSTFCIAFESFTCSLPKFIEKKEFTSNTNYIAKQIIRGVGYLHDNRIAHNDIMPESVAIVITNQPTPIAKICNFGRAMRLQNETSEQSLDGRKVRHFRWKAPETLRLVEIQRESRLNMDKADVFSLGCVLYYVITGGQHPFGSTVTAPANISDAHFSPDRAADYPVIEKMIFRDPNLRPTCREVLESRSFSLYQ